MARRNRVPGINIQFPWSRLIVDGKKSIETRGYPCPSSYLNQELAVIETGNGPCKIIGTIKITSCRRYNDKLEWSRDRVRHLVKDGDKKFSFESTDQKWAWHVEVISRYEVPLKGPMKKGILYAKEVEIG